MSTLSYYDPPEHTAEEVLAALDVFMALGEHHGFWTVVTPMTLGFDRDSDEAKQMAGMGLVMIAGFKSEAVIR